MVMVESPLVIWVMQQDLWFSNVEATIHVHWTSSRPLGWVDGLPGPVRKVDWAGGTAGFDGVTAGKDGISTGTSALNEKPCLNTTNHPMAAITITTPSSRNPRDRLVNRSQPLDFSHASRTVLKLETSSLALWTSTRSCATSPSSWSRPLQSIRDLAKWVTRHTSTEVKPLSMKASPTSPR